MSAACFAKVACVVAFLLLFCSSFCVDASMPISTSVTSLERDLKYWTKDLGPCPENSFQTLLAYDPLLKSCNHGYFTWDKVSAFMVEIVITRSGNWAKTNLAYLPFYNDVLCQDFGDCAWRNPQTGDYESLSQYYYYDCSNTEYCGPNAVRGCDGTYQDVPCPAGVTPPTPIQKYSQVECNKWLDFLADFAPNNYGPDLCSPSCVLTQQEPPVYAYVCNESCIGCTGSGRCLYQAERSEYAERFQAVKRCAYASDDTTNVWCLTYAKGLQRLWGGFTDTSCTLELNGSPCNSCSVCGTVDHSISPILQHRGDCSNVVPGATFDECTKDFNGLFSIVGEPLDATQCPATRNAPFGAGSSSSSSIMSPLDVMLTSTTPSGVIESHVGDEDLKSRPVPAEILSLLLSSKDVESELQTTQTTSEDASSSSPICASVASFLAIVMIWRTM